MHEGVTAVECFGYARMSVPQIGKPRGRQYKVRAPRSLWFLKRLFTRWARSICRPLGPLFSGNAPRRHHQPQIACCCSTAACMLRQPHGLLSRRPKTFQGCWKSEAEASTRGTGQAGRTMTIPTLRHHTDGETTCRSGYNNFHTGTCQLELSGHFGASLPSMKLPAESRAS